MAAYAALVSLMNTINNIQIHPRFSTCFSNEQIEYLCDTAGFLLDFIESYNCSGSSKEVEDLEAEIASAAHAAEDVLESHIVDQILSHQLCLVLVNFLVMAAYAAVVSLMNTMHLEAEIASAAHTAEDVLESNIVDQILAGSTKKNPEGSVASAAKDVLESDIVDEILHGSIEEDPEGESAFAAGDVIESHIPDQIPEDMDLQQVTEDMDSIKEYIIARFLDKQSTPPASPPAASSRPLIAGKTSVMGFEEYLFQLMHKLTWQQSHQQVIPIIGMGGVGKTTLARNAFDHLLIKQHFDVRAWATISQKYSTREILFEILSSQEDSSRLVHLNEQELGEKLHKCLFNRRYLIILDDMWSIEVWDGIKFSFPDNNNGSRIVVTTRLLEIALHFNSPYLTVNLLDKDKSWKLFCQESFGKEDCPAELEEALCQKQAKTTVFPRCRRVFFPIVDPH